MSLRAQPASPPPDSPSAPPLPGGRGELDHTVLRSGRSLLARVTRGVLLAQEGGMFEQTAELLTDTHRRLRGHPVAESVTVMPGVLLNLGLAQTLCGRFAQAEDHLCEALSLAEERRLPLMDMVVRQNLGCLSLYRGDASGAIATFHGLTDRLPPERREALHVDLAEALLAEGLVEEAATALADGPWADGAPASANTMLVEAKLWLLRGDLLRTVELTRRVRHMFGTGSLWYRLAARLERIAVRGDRSRPVSRARNALAVRRPLAVARPHGGAARHRALDALDRAAPRLPGPWLAEAGSDPHVVQAGLESALEAGDAAAALEWAELARTWAVPHVPGPGLRTPATVSLAEHYRDALVHGRDPDTAARRLESARWQAHHETRSARPSGAPPPSAPARGHAGGPPRDSRVRPVADALLERLGDRAFVRYTRAGGEAVALVAVAGRVHARVLGPLRHVARVLGRFVHPLLLPGHAFGTGAQEAADAAADALLGPLLPLVGDRPLVVAGDPYLGDPPWGVLPPLRGRPVHLVPTARFWLDHAPSGTAAPAAPERVLLVAAPGPAGAGREVAGLAGLYPGARVLTADRTGRFDVLAAFGEADLVHLAGHGRVPHRSPMLASVTLDDGPLLACDLAALPRVPDVVVLSTCWSGRGFADRAGAPLGFVGALLAAGVRAVVASPVPVGDSRTDVAMRRFHRAFARGVPLPEAVAVHLGRIGFCCFGV
ncbi:hypothetical protein HNR06_000745 [Nocardiopsis arvandica]|uniref:CHAT domain-containing protein n=1 Tax=Nocardiopsis sinuspersici TaxID=501010 RepID=A0A7Y9X8I1_9ACTN|nr:hypothetical protein [Nocardiopsis sinuspersici]